MTHKKKALYKAVFEYLKNELSVDASSVMSDWERAIRSAAREIWEHVELSGCYFHFTQALKRQARKDKRLSVVLTRNFFASGKLSYY